MCLKDHHEIVHNGLQKSSKPVTNDPQYFSSRSSKSLILDVLSVSQELFEELQRIFKHLKTMDSTIYYMGTDITQYSLFYDLLPTQLKHLPLILCFVVFRKI